MKFGRPIEGYPGYAVSNGGRVKSLKREVLRSGHMMKLQECMLKPRALKKGHMYVNLRRDNKATSTYVHRLVAMAFIGRPPPDKPHIAHWDGDPSNNDVSNLRWVTPKENSADTARLGRHKRPGGTESSRGKFSDEDLLKILSKPAEKPIRTLAKELGVSHNAVGYVLRGLSYKNDVARIWSKNPGL